jgi:nitrite reductase (NO-forming)
MTNFNNTLFALSLALAMASCAGGRPKADNIRLPEVKASVLHESILPGPALAGEVASKVPFTKPAPRDKKVHHVRMDITNQAFEVGDGKKFMAWPFGGDLPGPTIRVRQGDTLKFTMANRTDEEASLSFGYPMPHSMDFHSALVSPQDKYRSIAPGMTLEFEFEALYPGVYMYHCGTPMILEHLVAGMYGAMIVEPRDGYPTKVDREYVLVQSELYLKKSDKKGFFVSDIEAAKQKRSTMVVFNGRFQRHVTEPLIAKKGERVRLFVLNAGPSGTSSFHVVGTIFDKVWLEGNPFNELRASQTVLLGASNSAIVEFLIPEKAKYIMVDHEFADATAGALGLIDASESEDGSAE